MRSMFTKIKYFSGLPGQKGEPGNDRIEKAAQVDPINSVNFKIHLLNAVLHNTIIIQFCN